MTKIKDKTFVMVSALIVTKEKRKYFLDFSMDLTNGKLICLMQDKIDKEDKNLMQHIRNYILNSLLFLNEPRVVTYIIHTNNQRREKKGLIPIPSLLMTRITKELNEYINIAFESHSKLGYAFDVRGHWRVFHHPRYGNNIGKKIWIAPFLKGEGMKPPQIFEMCA